MRITVWSTATLTSLRAVSSLLALLTMTLTTATQARERWTVEQAHRWGQSQPWLIGSNFIPSTAINQLEMWQAETFDPRTIESELGWASEIGYNTVRVYLHDLLWKTEGGGGTERIRPVVRRAAALLRRERGHDTSADGGASWTPTPRSAGSRRS